MFLEEAMINEELIGVDFETTIQAYLQRDIRFNLYPNEIILKALNKLSFDGNSIHFLNEIKYINPNFLSVIINNADTELFYRFIGFDALNYIGY